ncbi:MAG: oligosaccharide flippase family protein [Bacteroidota bacterium]
MLKRLSLNSEFARNSAALILGTIVAQSIPILLQPVLRRIYTPEDFGAMAVYLTLLSMLTIAFSLRYEAAIVLPRNDRAAANLLSLTFLVNLVFSLVLLLCIILFREDIAHLIGLPEKYSASLFFLPAASLAFSMYQSINYWLIRQKAFKLSASNKVIRRSAEGLVQAGSGFMKIPGGLFIGDLAGNVLNVLSGIRQVFRTGFKLGFVSGRKMRYVSRKYADFPKYNLLPTLMSNAATVLPFLLINKFYSTETVGYVDLSRLVLSIPLIFISATVSQVFFQQTVEKIHRSQSVKSDMTGVLYIVLAIVLAEMLLIFLFGPELFAFVFGSNYGVSGIFSQILVFSFALNFIGSTFSFIFIAFGKIRMNSIWQVVYFLAICSLFFIKGLVIEDFLKIYVLIEVIMHLAYCCLAWMIIQGYERKINTGPAD